MLTGCVAGLVLGGCWLVRRTLDRPGRRMAEFAGGRVRLKPLRNRGAAFGLPVTPKALPALSAAALALIWTLRLEHPVSVGLILGGGLSNLWERLRHGAVLDYLRFPKAPGRLKRYVYNLADLAIFLGGLGLLWKKK